MIKEMAEGIHTKQLERTLVIYENMLNLACCAMLRGAFINYVVSLACLMHFLPPLFSCLEVFPHCLLLYSKMKLRLGRV